MVKKPLLLAVERAQIVALHMERLSERQIVKRLQCNKSSVHRAIEKFKKHEIYNEMKKLVDSVKLQEEMIIPSNELLCNPPLVLVVKYVKLS